MMQLPKFEGRPLFELPKSLPIINFLGGDLGKTIDERIQEKYGEFDAINKVKYNPKTKTIEGSTTFYPIVAEEFLSEGLRTSTASDMAVSLRVNKNNPEIGLNTRGYYVDLGVVARSDEEPNSRIAKRLIEQAKTRNIEVPFYAPNNALRVEKDNKSDYGLSLGLKENASFIHAGILNKPGNFTSEDVDEKSGLPRQTGDKGDRTLYTRNSGLSRLCLGRLLYLDSRLGYLEYSASDGRVVVVGDSVIDPEKYVSEINRSSTERKTRLQKLLDEAEARKSKIDNETIEQMRKQ